MLDNIYNAIVNHLNMKTTGALLLTGEWGSGKTYHLKNNVFPRLKTDEGYKFSMVSVYGSESLSDLITKVTFSCFEKKIGSTKSTINSALEITKDISKFIPVLEKYINIDQLSNVYSSAVFEFIKNSKILICFDDLERLSKKIQLADFLGFVNELVENYEAKVLLVVNESKLEEIRQYKEKTIEKTLVFSPDKLSILDSIIESYTKKKDCDKFVKYLKNNKSFLSETLKWNSVKGEFEEELKKEFKEELSVDLANIRTIKFAIEHYKQIFQIIENRNGIAEDIKEAQLKNLWVFILSISIEYRKTNSTLNFNNKKGLDIHLGILEGLGKFPNYPDDVQSDSSNEPSNEPEDFKTIFKTKYYNRFGKRLSEKYIFYSQVYDLITAGKIIDQTEFYKDLDENFNISEGKKHPAHQLLDDLLIRDWRFSDKDFKECLDKLLNYVQTGTLLNIESYINATNFLLEFVNLFNSTKEDIISKAKGGVDIFFGDLTLEEVLSRNFELKNVSNREVKFLFDHIMIKSNELEKDYDAKDLKTLASLIESDVKGFTKEFTPEGFRHLRFHKPILGEIEKSIIINSMKKWTGEEIMEIHQLIDKRFIKNSGSINLKSEVHFLNNLLEGINERDTSGKTLSNFLMEDKLKVKIIECKKRLENYEYIKN